MFRKISRRNILTAAGGLALAPSIPGHVFANPPRKKIGIALVGLGGYSTNQLAPALQLAQHCELRGIVTGSPSKIPVWQEKYGIKDRNVYSYENMNTIADNKDIDVVYIVLPTFLHAKYSIIAANAGKHVWCEKPMAMTVSECRSIIKACEKNKVRLSIGYRLQHEPNHRTVIQWAQSKPYGAQQKVIAKAGYAGSGRPQDDWRMDRSKGGGALYDMGVYPINVARYATGLEPVAVTAKHIIDRPELFKNADETTELQLEFRNGLIADCATSVGRNYNILRVDCEKGWYELEPMQTYDGVIGKTSDGKPLNKTVVNQQTAQMDNEALAIIENVPEIVPGIDGLNDIRVVEAALKSAASGKRVRI